MSNNNNKLQSSRLIFEELEERRLFSGGIEGLIGTDLDSDEQAIYADLDTSKTRTAEADENTSASTAEQQSQEIVFVDAGVDNYQQLVDDLLVNSDSSRNIEVVVLERDQDGIEQISTVLQDRDDLDAVHIISHGDDGSIELGNNSLNAFTLEENNLSIALWANSFAETGDILIYGCNLAETEAGQSLIDELSSLTLTDVAASTDLTGHADLGGDWQLEFSAGSIEASVAVSADAQQQWSGLLAETVYTSHETTTNTIEVKSDTNYGQTFTYTSGNSTYDVNKISLQLNRDVDTTSQNVTVYLRSSWDGADLASATISSDSLSTTMDWVDFDIGNVTLNDGATYYIRITSDSADGKIWLGDDTSGTYTDGDKLDVNGSPLGGEDLTFRVSEVQAETFTVSTTADSGPGSLLQAILDANANAGAADTIEFTVTGTINLTSALPTINDQVTIDGTTAPGYAGEPLIRIDGGSAGAGNGLTFADGSDGSSVQGLIITNFTGNGIQIDNGADGITITGNWIGTTGTGTTGDGNSNNGINVQGANTVIGGTGANEGNVITNNGNEGINLTGTGATGTLIQGNIIGLDPDGSTGSGNGDVGIALLSGSHNTIIGGTDPNAGNIISMNFEGIEINSNNNTIQGNYIGTDITGTLDRGNRSDDGIEIQNNATGNLIGGTEEGAGNLIAFNQLDGVNIVSGSDNAVLGNDIHSNGDQDIDLAAGANGDQAAPVLTSAQTNGSELTVSGSLSSTANSYFRIEFFGADQTYLGFVNVATDGSGNATFETTLSASVASGTLITSSATKSDAAYSTFTDTSAFSSTVVSGNAGTAIWAESGSNFPEYSEWDGTSFSAEGTAYPAGEWRIMQGAESPQRDEKIVIGVDASGNIEGMLWNGSSWSQISVGGSSIFGTVSASFWWGMDVQYESQSGDAVMVWNDGDNIEYATWDGTSWSSVGTISGFGGATPRQLQLATSPDSDEMVLVVSDSSSRDSVFVWDGTSWGSEQVLSTGGDDRTDIFVTYEQQSGHAMVVYGKANIDAYYRTWDGSSWSAEGSVSQAVGTSGNVRWTTMASDPNSDRIALGVLTSGGDVWFNVWDGNTWSTSTAATTTSTGTTELAMAVAFESTSGELLATYGESGSSTVRYMTWSAGSGWSGEQNGPNIGGTPNSMTLSSDPLSDRIMLAVNDDNSDVNYVLWNGSSWGTVTERETSSGETKNQPFLFLWDQVSANQAPVITSDGSGATAAVNVAENTTAVTTVTATDPDLQTPTFSITGGADAALFDIDTNSGALTFKTAPDFEGAGDNLYEVEVTAADGFGGSDLQTISVRVTDVAEGIRVTPTSVVPLGDETLVNTETTDNQTIGANVSQAIATDANGNYVIVWASNLQDGSGWGIYAQLFNADGTAQAGEIPVNTTFTDSQLSPSVAMDDAGNFVVAWQSENQDGSSYGVYTRSFDAAGNPTSTETLVNTETSNYQGSPGIAMAPNGDYVVIWTSSGQDNPDGNSGIYAQLFNADGSTNGGEFLINTYTLGHQQVSSVSMDDSGNFIVTWGSQNQDGSNYGVFAQLFDANGVTLGSEFQVNTTTDYSQLYNDVVMLPDGRFVVAFQSVNADTSTDLLIQRYESDGTPIGGEIKVNSVSDMNFFPIPSITADENGNFTVVWNNSNDGAGNGVFVRSYDWDGNALTGELQVNTTAAGDQTYPDVVAQPGGGFIVVWGGEGAGDTDGVFMQRYGLATDEDGGSTAFELVLESAPTADVVIPISVSDGSEGSASVGSITFTSGNWNIAQTVTVTGLQDFIPDGDQTYTVDIGPATSTDLNFNGLDPANLSIVNLANTAPQMTAWFNDAWDSRKELTISSAQVVDDVSNFPVLITLNTDAELAAQALANGDDIVFTAADGVTQLAHEIEFFDETTGELRVWVKTDLSGTVDTDIYMYFGNAAATNQQNAAGVWADYVGVYHLGESPDGTPGEIIDSSGSGNHGTTEGAMDGSDSVAATIGQGLAFDGANDMIRIPNSTSLDSINDEATFSLWINFVDAADGDTQIIMTSADRYTTGAVDGYEWASQNDGDHFFYPDAGSPDVNYNLGANPFTNGTWHHLAATMDFTTKTVEIYVDGSPMTFSYEGTTGNWTTPTTSTADLLFGGNPDRATRFFNGMMDEIRIAGVARSQEWLQTEYNNQKTPGTFFSVGVSEDREDKLTDINEDDFNSAGDSVLSIINSSGADRITDDDSGAFEGIAVSGVDNTNGQWQYDANADGTWIAFGSVSDTNAVLLDTGALIRFVPNADYNGSAGDLIFHAWDQTSGANGDTGVDVSTNGGNTAYSSETFDATLNVLPVDDAAIITGDTSYSGSEGDTVAGDLNATDVDGLTDSTYFSVTTQASNGTAAINLATGAWTFTPTDANWFGSDSFTVTVTDDLGGTTTQVVSITLANVNDPPVISIDPSPILYLNGTMAVDPNLTVNDVDNATLQSAQVWFGDGYLRGQDRLLFTDQLGITGSFDMNAGVLTLTGSASVADYETALRSVQYEDFNPTPAEGILYVNFSVSDGTDTSVVDTRVLEIVDNLPPRAADDFGTAAEGGSVVIDLAANDTDSDDALDLTSIVITSGPSNGSVVVNGDGTVTYTHNGSETASDTFTYTIRDADGNLSNEAPVSITVTVVNDAPSVGVNTGATVNEGSTGTVITSLMLNEGDPDDSGAGLTYTVTSIPGYGTLRLNGTALALNDTFTQADIDAGNLTYDHDGSENFSDGFGFSLADGGEDGATAASGTFTIGVTPVNDLPTIGGTDTGSVQEDVGVVANNISTTGTLTITDPDTGESTFQAATINGTYGDLTIDTAGNWTYTADNTQAAIQQLDALESITDTLTVTSFDGTTHNVVITINGSEDAAVISGTTTGSVTEDGTLTSSGALTITDTDTSDSPSFADVGVTAGNNNYGSFEMTSGTWTYTLDNNNAAVQALDAGETLSDTFTFTASDGSSQLVTVTINGAEDAPVFDSTAVTAATEDVAYSYTITTSDVDIESVTITAPTLPAWLTFVDNGDGTATLSGTPTNAEVGSHNVVLNVSDGTLSSNQNFTIVVGNTNDPAVIGGTDTGAVTEDVAVVANNISTTGTLTIADPDTGESTFQAATINGTYGDLTIDTAGNWTYAADNTQAAIQQLDALESITDTLTVTSFDGTTHNVVITINGSEDAAVISGTTTGSVTEDGTLTSSGTLSITDTDTSDSPSFADVGARASDNGYGSFVMTAGTWTYTLDNNNAAVQALDVGETLTDTHTFTASDGSTQQVTITINGAEDTPVFDSTAVTAATEDVAYSYTITTSDVDVESVTITAPTLPAWLTFVDNGDGTATLSGTPTNAEVGNHNVVLNVSDGTLSSNQNFTISVANTNDPAVIGGTDTGSVQEDVGVVANNISTTGTLTIADPDTGESTFQAATINGTYGDLTINTAGNWTYTADNTQAAIQQLDALENITDTLTVTSFDGTTHNVVITINGSEDAAVISGTTTGSVTEDGTLTSSGTLSITDTDASDPTDFADLTPQAGDNGHGTFEITSNTWTYTLDNNDPAVQALDVGETLTDTYTFTAPDGVTQLVTVTINGAEDAPVFDSTAVTAATEDVAYSYTITTSDVDVESVTITAPTLPAWLTFVDNGDGTATLSGTPTNAEVGSHNVVLNVSDGTLSSNQNFTIVVGNTNDPAVIGGVDTGSVQEDVAVVANNISTTGTLTIADPDVGESTFQAETVTGTYGDLTIDTAGNWTYTADNTQAAIQQLDALENITDTLTVTSFDGTTHNVVITINGSEDAAVISGTTTGSVTEDGTLTSSGALTITDTDTSDTPSFADVGVTAGDNGYGSFVMTAGTWTYTLDNNNAAVQALDAGETLTDTYTFTASDGSTQQVTVTINGAEDTPVFDSTAITAATEDAAYSYTITTSDVDVESVTITAPTLPAWLTLVDNGNGTATLSGTPTNAEVGSHNVVLNVSDGTLSSNQNFTITVANTPDAAVIGGIDTGAVQEDVAVSSNTISTTGTLTITDPDTGESTFQAATINGTYGDLTIDTAGNWSYTADNTQAAIQQLDALESVTDTLTVTSFDGTPHNVVITINGSEDAAVISGTTTGSVTEDGTITSSGALAITDTDTSDTPSFADVTSTAGDNGYGSFEMTAGTWTYTLNNAHPAVQALDVGETLTDTHTFTASDGSTQQITITINGAEDTPVFDSTAVTAATEDSAYSYTIITSDVDVESVTITAPTLPAWLTLVDNGDGTATLSGTPTNAEVGNHNVVLNVSDGTLNSNQNFTITVANTPDAAVIGGVDTGAVQEDVAVVANNISTTGTLTITDPDAGESTFQAGTVNGTYGDLTIDTAGNWSYTADNTQAAIQQLDVSESLTDTLTVTSFDGTTHNVVITINGSEDTAVTSGTTIGSVTEDGTLTSSGALAIADTDTSDSPGFADVTSTAGDNGYGSFVMTAGTWTYTLDNNHAAVQALDVSETLTDTHTFTATDGSTQVVTVTINGAEDAPTLDNSIADQTATESVAFGYTFAANSFGDLDVSDSLTYSATLGDNSPLPAWLSFDGPTRTFSGTPGVGDTGAIDIKIIADDGSSTVTDIFTLTVDPQNSAPAVGGIDQAAVTEDRDLQSGDLSAEGALTIADPDAGQSSFVAQTINGSFGALTIDASGNWRYLADNANAEIQALQSGQSVNETLTVTTADGSTHQVVITINGTTEAPPAPPQVAGPPVEEPLPLEEIPSAEEEVKLGSIGGEDPILEEIVRIPQAAVLPTPTEQDHGVAQGDEPEAEAVNYGPVIDKRTAKIPELRPAQALQASNLSLDTLTLQVTDDEALNERYELELLSRIDRMHLGMDSEAARQAADDVEVQIVVGSTASLTVGIVSWVLRSGALLASLMSSVPLLNKFDPLPILKGRDDEEDVEPDEDEDTQTGDHARKVDNMFSGKGSEKQ